MELKKKKHFMWNSVSLRIFFMKYISTKMELKVCKLSTPRVHTDSRHSNTHIFFKFSKAELCVTYLKISGNMVLKIVSLLTKMNLKFLFHSEIYKHKSFVTLKDYFIGLQVCFCLQLKKKVWLMYLLCHQISV